MTAIWEKETSLGDLVRSGQGYDYSQYLPALHATAEPFRTRFRAGQWQSNPNAQSVLSPWTDRDNRRPWVNDPVRFIWDENTRMFRAWLLTSGNYDSDYTTWLEVVTPDLVNWVANRIPFYTAGLPSPNLWGGCAFIDREGTAGFGKNAAIYIMTAPAGSISPYQSQVRFVAPALGLAPVYNRVVLENPGAGAIVHAPGLDFRDPRVDWDDISGQWVMKLTIGYGIAFYGSADTEEWKFLSLIDLSAWQQIETPDLLPIMTEDGIQKWILAFSLKTWNGQPYSTCGYLIGQWDGQKFIPDFTTPKLMNYGADFYAQALSPHEDAVYCWAWMGNWVYAGALPTQGFTGNQTIVTKLSVSKDPDGTYGVSYTPVEGQERAYADSQTYYDIPITGNMSWSPDLTNPGLSWRVDATLSFLGAVGKPDAVHFDICVGDANKTRLTLDFVNGTLTLSRSGSGGVPLKTDDPAMLEEWNKDRSAPLSYSAFNKLVMIYDNSALEIIFNGKTYLSNTILPPEDAYGMKITNAGNGGFILSELTLYC